VHPDGKEEPRNRSVFPLSPDFNASGTSASRSATSRRPPGTDKWVSLFPAGSIELRQNVPTAGIRFGEKLRNQLLCKPDVLEDRQIRAAPISGQTEKLQDSSRGIVDSPSSSNFHGSESEIDF
jgi:hypothetical protein